MICIAIVRPTEIKKQVRKVNKKTLYEYIMEFFRQSEQPARLRDVYEYCSKFGQWNPRSIRRCVEEVVMAGYVYQIRCPCGHSHLYMLKTKTKTMNNTILVYDEGKWLCQIK